MAGERLSRILARSSSDGGPEPGVAQVCTLAVELAGVTGAGVMLMPEDVPWGSLFTSDGVSAVVEDLQFALGEGPCLDAHLDDRPVLEPDLTAPVTLRWPAFTGPAVHQASGMVAVQLGVEVSEALVRLRAYAFGNERVLRDVARDVVARRLRFNGPGERHGTGR